MNGKKEVVLVFNKMNQVINVDARQKDGTIRQVPLMPGRKPLVILEGDITPDMLIKSRSGYLRLLRPKAPKSRN